MKKNLSLTLIFTILISLNSCSFLGTKTIFKAKHNFPIVKIGFAKIESGEALNNIYPKTCEVFNKTLLETFSEYNLKTYNQLGYEITYDNPEISIIRDFCKNNELDGLLVTKLNFVNIKYDMLFSTINDNFNTEVEMKFFDKNGNLIVEASHNTYHGNSYFNQPPPNITVHDGVKGVLIRILNELNISRAGK